MSFAYEMSSLQVCPSKVEKYFHALQSRAGSCVTIKDYLKYKLWKHLEQIFSSLIDKTLNMQLNIHKSHNSTNDGLNFRNFPMSQCPNPPYDIEVTISTRNLANSEKTLENYKSMDILSVAAN